MPNLKLLELHLGMRFFFQALLEYMIGNCKQNLIDAEIILVQPKVEQVVNENFTALRLSMKNTSAVSNANNNKPKGKFINKNQTPRIGQPKFTPMDFVQDCRDFRKF